MSTVEAAATVAAILIVALPTLYVQLQRARRHEAIRDRIISESLATSGRVGPYDPRLPAGINAALDDYAALDEDLAPVFGPRVDPLPQAIRDDQNNTKGDQK